MWTDKNIYIEKIDGSDSEPGSGHKQTTITIQKNGITVEAWKNIEGPVKLTESGEYTVTVTTEDNVGNISTKYEIIVGNANYVIDDNKYAEKLEQAIEKSTDGSTIKLLNDYTDISTATISKNVTFDVQDYTLTRNATITINSGKTVEITGTGKITTEANNARTITNNGILTISNSITIENMSTSTNYAPIYTNNSSSIININDNVIINGYYRGIYNNSGRININGGIIKATYQASSAYGIYNNSSNSKAYINDGVIEGYTGIYNNNSSSLIEIAGGKIIGTGASGISGGTANIYGGRIEGKTYGIYNTATNKVTIGKQDDELSTTNPAIYGESYGIYMSDETYSFNFYNGVIISNAGNTAYRGVLNPRTGHMPYTYLDYEIEQKYCTILVLTIENITMEVTPTEYTNKDVTVKITYPYIEGTTKQYSEDGTEWKEAKQYIQEIIVTENKTIYARTLNESEIITEEQQIEVDNIDKEKPTVTISPSQTNYSVTSSTETADITLTITATDTGVSGLDVVQYAWAEEGEEPTYVDFTNTVTISKTKLAIGQYNLYLNVTDKAGNKADLVQMRYTVKFEEPVCQIGSTTYTTIQSAIDACSKEEGDTQTTIEILKNTDEEFTTYEGQKIILDLKGYTIGNSSLDTPLCTNNGTLTLIDTSTEQAGKLESLNGTAVLNNGTFTIGDNSTSIEMEVPTIYGQKIGINNQGTFNFYDGKIQGITPTQGKVTDTPEEYGPVTTDYNNGITTMQLGIVTGYEARIEWVYYTTVQETIDATRTNKKETVIILKNIQLKEIAVVNATKDIILDLDGYELTIASENDRVINNYGNLEITDSSEKQTGQVNIESTSTCYGIYNNGTGSVKINGGTVSAAVSSDGWNNSYGLYNASTGTVEISGGTVNSSTSGNYSNSYGIYNNSTGNIIIGAKGDVLVSQEELEIIAKYTGNSTNYTGNGIYNPNGTLKYYDGIIKGITKAIYGNIEEIEDLTELVVTTETIDSKEYETLKLQQTTTNVASVNDVEYDSIQKAVEACGTTESTIKILRDSNPGATVTIEEGQNITLDLNGYTTNTYQGITNKGTLKITDTSTEQTGKIVGLAGIAISNIGTMELLSGSISDSGYGIKNTGTLNITGGNIQNNSYGIYNDGSGIINITEGSINSNTYGIYNYSSNATSNITGGTIISNEYGIYNSNGTTNITSTGITGNTYGVYNAGGTTNLKEGAEITSNTGVYVANGTLNIGETGTMNSSSPVITGETYGLSVASAGTVYMYDGQVKGKTGATQGYITYTESGYQVANKTEGEYNIDYLALAGTVSTVAQVNGVDFSNLQSAINSVTGEEAQTITLTNGIISDITFTIAEGQNIILDMNGKTISSDLEITIENAGSLTIIDSTTSGVAKISSTVGTAIKNTGTLTQGEDDGAVNQEIITIDGTTYGIENSGTLNFYDGTINGASAVNGTITNRATGYVIRTTTVDGKERYYLST